MLPPAARPLDSSVGFFLMAWMACLQPYQTPGYPKWTRCGQSGVLLLDSD